MVAGNYGTAFCATGSLAACALAFYKGGNAFLRLMLRHATFIKRPPKALSFQLSEHDHRNAQTCMFPWSRFRRASSATEGNADFRRPLTAVTRVRIPYAL